MKTRSTAGRAKSSSDVACDGERGGANEAAATGAVFWEPLALIAVAAKPAEALQRTLALLGPLYRADRVWLGRYNAELTHFWGVADWVLPGVVSHFQETQGVSVNVITDAQRKLLRGDDVVIPDVERMPRQTRSLQAELRREGVRSTLACPLAHGERLIGFFGFDYVREPAAWTPADLGRLPALKRFLAALLHRSLTTIPPADLPTNPHRSIYVTERSSLRALSLDDVIFIEADGDYSRVHADDGRRYLERRSLRAWIVQLPRERFLRVHQRYLINGTRIARLDRGVQWTLRLQDVPDRIPVGRAFRHALRLHMGF